MGTAGHLRSGVAAAVAVVTLGVAVPAPVAADPVDRLRETWDQLDDARGGLSEAETAVEEAASALSLVDARLDAASARLRDLEGQLAEAEAAYDEAQARTEEVNARLRGVDRQLRALVAEGDRHQDALDDMAAITYMHGGRARTSELLATLLASNDLHELNVGYRVVERELDDDQELVVRSTDVTVSAARARTEFALLRGERVRAEVAAETARDRVRSVVAAQARTAAEIASERDRRSEILAQTEGDRAQAAALVERLEQVSAELSAQLQTAIDIRWQDLQIDGPMPEWAAALPGHGRRWAPAIQQAAVQVGIDPRLFAALVWSESNFHPGAVSHAGAVGLTQLMPGTAAGMGVDPWHPLQNLAGGARYLASQYARFGSVELALAAYNAGPGAVERYGGIPPYAETQYYVLAVLRRYQRLSA